MIGNALKFSPPGTPVTVQTSADDGTITITVTDQGPGIDAGSLPHVFDRFYRSLRTAATGGSGVGLSVARGFVEAHHGTMTVRSDPGHGAAFTIRIPREEPDA